MTTGNAPSRGDAGRALRFPVVVFDLDGVLVDTERVNIAAATEAFATVGVKLHESDHSLIVGRHPLDYVPDLAQRHGLPPSIALRAQRLQTEAWTRLARDVPALAHVVPTIRELRARGVRLAVATSSERASAEPVLAAIGIRTHFETVCTRDDVRSPKPDPELYTLAITRLGVLAQDALAIEDSPHGIAAAKAAGLRCLAVRSPHIDVGRLGRADAIVPDVAAVLAYI